MENVVNLTSEQVKKMKLNQLIVTAVDLNIEYKKQSKEQLQEAIIKILNDRKDPRNDAVEKARQGVLVKFRHEALLACEQILAEEPDKDPVTFQQHPSIIALYKKYVKEDDEFFMGQEVLDRAFDTVITSFSEQNNLSKTNLNSQKMDKKEESVKTEAPKKQTKEERIAELTTDINNRLEKETAKSFVPFFDGLNRWEKKLAKDLIKEAAEKEGANKTVVELNEQFFPKKEREPRTQNVELNAEQKNILASKESKSEKIRLLSDTGLTVAQIAREVGAHYSFAHTVVTNKEDYRKMQAEKEEKAQKAEKIEAAKKAEKEAKEKKANK